MFKSKYFLVTLTILLLVALLGTVAHTADTLLSQGKPASASSSQGNNPAANANDGNTSTRWAATSTSYPQWWKVDLGAINNLTRVDITWYNGSSRAYKYKIEVSTDNSTFATKVDKTGNTTNGNTSDSFTATGRYVRITVTGCSSGAAYASANEIKVYGSTSINTPTPTVVPPTTTPTGPTVTPTVTPTGGPTPTPYSDFWGDTSNIPTAKNKMMFKIINRTNGKYPDSQVYWSFKSGTINEVHTIAEQPYYDMPANSSGRMYFGIGAPPDPNNASGYWDFIEFTINTNFNGNTTRVDAFGLKIAIRLHCADGYDEVLGEDYSLFQEDRAVTFQRFIDEVPTEFKHLAQVKAPYRIINPGAGEFKAGGLYANYWSAYVDQVWAANGITIAKPGSYLSGLGSYPSLSAALHRHVAEKPGTFSSAGKLLDNSIFTNYSQQYPAAPGNYYAKFWHDHGLQNKAYGFPYDDAGNWAAYVSHGSPQYLIVAVGW